jgi:polyisoprenoid-binding protein YceI
MRSIPTRRRLAQVVALVALLASLTTSLAAGQAEAPAAPGRLLFGTLSFDGHATLGAFTGVTQTVSGEMAGGPALESVRGWVEAPVGTLATGKDKRDADLRKSMEVERYPVIRYELDSVTAMAVVGDSAEVVLHGRFIIHGVTRGADLDARALFHDGAARVWGNTPLNLKDYRIGGLSKMLGMLKMHEEIEVHVDLTFAAAPIVVTARD